MIDSTLKSMLIWGVVLLGGFHSCSSIPPGELPIPATQIPEVVTPGVLNYDALSQAKTMIQEDDPSIMPAYHRLATEAEGMLALKAPSVMDKGFLPPSGDKHDYASMGPYWWPDPEKEDGLPYIRKDGEVNPERNQFDKLPGATMSVAVRALTLMYTFTDDQKYAEKAAEYLRTWFIDPDTRMHAHLEYGQFIPGRSDGRSVGIIESRNFVFLIDYEPLLTTSEFWTDADHQAFKAWMIEFHQWLTTSELGLEERARGNNHGSWCDYQVLALSQYSGEHELGKNISESIQSNRLEKQIESNGQQPEELARTKSFNYSVFNLSALIKIAILSENYGIDLSRKQDDPSELKLAIDYLLPFVTGEQTWEFKQISSMAGSQEKMIYILNYANQKWPQQNYADALIQLSSKFPESSYHLTTQAFHSRK